MGIGIYYPEPPQNPPRTPPSGLGGCCGDSSVSAGSTVAEPLKRNNHGETVSVRAAADGSQTLESVMTVFVQRLRKQPLHAV